MSPNFWTPKCVLDTGHWIVQTFTTVPRNCSQNECAYDRGLGKLETVGPLSQVAAKTGLGLQATGRTRGAPDVFRLR